MSLLIIIQPNNINNNDDNIILKKIGTLSPFSLHRCVRVLAVQEMNFNKEIKSF